MHSVPRWSDVALEQIRSVGLRLRAFGALLLGALILYALVAMRVAANDHAATVAHVRHSVTKFEFTPDISILIAYLALLLPALVWHEENPAKRMYHLSMPVGRSAHALTKVFAGWVWLMAGTAVFLLVVISVDGITSNMEGAQWAFATHVAAWEWLVPFTAVTIAYALSSAAAVGAKTPAVWIVGPPVIYVGVAILIAMLGASKVSESMFTLFSGYYGAAAAIGGRYVGIDSAGPRVVRWLVTTALWGSATAALLVVVSRARKAW
jgi:hypothetical protein